MGDSIAQILVDDYGKILQFQGGYKLKITGIAFALNFDKATIKLYRSQGCYLWRRVRKMHLS